VNVLTVCNRRVLNLSKYKAFDIDSSSSPPIALEGKQVMNQDYTSDVWLITGEHLFSPGPDIVYISHIGTSSGFGKRLVTSALARGDRVIATARSLDKLESALGNLNSEVQNRIRFLQLDVTDGEEKIKNVIDEAAAFWGRIDVLVNNAGLWSFVGLPCL